MGVEHDAVGRGLLVDDLLAVRQQLVPGCRHRSDAGRAALAGVPAHGDDVEQERPAVQLAVHRAFVADRGDQVVQDVLGDVAVPRLDHVGLNERGHLDKWRHADIHVPGAGLIARLGHEAVDAEALDGCDLEIEWRGLLERVVDLRQRRMQIDDPLVEGRSERPR